MIVNRQSLLDAAPIKDMLTTKERAHGVSFGLTEAGYDIRIKQEILFQQRDAYQDKYEVWVTPDPTDRFKTQAFLGRFVIASAIEEFDMPRDLVGVVHDKSTWARMGLSVFNTVIEPGWKGFLTLELVYHGAEPLVIPAGAGIAQVLFHRIEVPQAYDGKYQNQANRPVEAIYEKG